MTRPRLAAIAVVLAAVVTGAYFHGRAADRPPDLIQAGDSKTNCIYAKLGHELQAAEKATGVRYRCLETFSTSAPNWRDWSNPWLLEKQYGYKAWVAADPLGRQLILTINIIPSDVATNPSWTKRCATGSYNQHAKELSRNLIDNGFGYAVVRLGPEMNGTWNVSSLGTTVNQWHEWAECFAQEVRAMRSVRGSHLLFDWDVNADYRDIPLSDFYPGNAYVDIIGIDDYDGSGAPLPKVGSHRRWKALSSEPDGLNSLEAFAIAHAKPLSIPEWATIADQGDDAEYVTGMGNFVATHNVAFQSWFDVGDKGILQLSSVQAPKSLAAYIKEFG